MGRRHGRAEDRIAVMKYLYDAERLSRSNLFMEILVDEENGLITETHDKRQRKQGMIEGHPIDLFAKIRQCENLPLFEQSIIDRDEKTSWFRRASSIGSIRSSFPSRKSSVKSSHSTSTAKTSNSTIKKNSGNFDGWNIRKKSSATERKLSLPNNVKKISAERDKVFVEFSKNLEKLDDDTSSESSLSSDGNTKQTKLNNLNNIPKKFSSLSRTQEYVLKHALQVEKHDPQNKKAEEIVSIEEEDEGFQSLTPKVSIKDEIKSSDQKCCETQIYKCKDTKKFEQSSRCRHYGDVDTRQLNQLLFDENKNIFLNKFDSLPKQKVSRAKSVPTRPICKIANFEPIEIIPSLEKVSIKNKNESTVSVSTDSANGSIRSLSTLSSDTFPASYNFNAHRPSVPINFIPGMTTPDKKRPRNRSLPLSLTVSRKASFCFKGVTCRVFHTSPKTYKALAHAGCMGLIIPAPESHKCKN